MKKKILLLSLGWILVSLILTGLTFNMALGAYPERPINYIICFNPGGESDLTARLQQPLLEKVLGVSVIISYKIGGGGALGWSELVKAKPDGYTIAGDNIPHIILQPLIRKETGYKTEQLKQIYCFEFTPDVLVVKNDSPFKSLSDLLDYAKKHPGAVTLGGSGSPSANSLGVAKLNKEAGVDITYVPFTGSAPTIPALLGGHVTGLMSYSTMAIVYKKKLRPLAVASEERFPALPDVPTFKELGLNVVEGAWRGVAAPPGTPDEIINTLAKAFDKVCRDDKFVGRMEAMGFQVVHWGPEEYTKFVQKKTEEYKKILKELGLLK